MQARKPGRPVSTGIRDIHTVNIRSTEEWWQSLKLLAVQQKKGIATIIRDALEKQHGDQLQRNRALLFANGDTSLEQMSHE